MAIFCHIKYFKTILCVKFYFESIGDNSKIRELLFLEILAKSFDEKSADIFENKNPETLKLSPINSKFQVFDLTKNRHF
jgi:hypothetical protein